MSLHQKDHILTCPGTLPLDRVNFSKWDEKQNEREKKEKKRKGNMKYDSALAVTLYLVVVCDRKFVELDRTRILARDKTLDRFRDI